MDKITWKSLLVRGYKNNKQEQGSHKERQAAYSHFRASFRASPPPHTHYEVSFLSPSTHIPSQCTLFSTGSIPSSNISPFTYMPHLKWQKTDTANRFRWHHVNPKQLNLKERMCRRLLYGVTWHRLQSPRTRQMERAQTTEWERNAKQSWRIILNWIFERKETRFAMN